MTSEIKFSNRASMKPAIAPKPKLICKPHPPPKPQNLLKSVTPKFTPISRRTESEVTKDSETDDKVGNLVIRNGDNKYCNKVAVGSVKYQLSKENHTNNLLNNSQVESNNNNEVSHKKLHRLTPPILNGCITLIDDHPNDDHSSITSNDESSECSDVLQESQALDDPDILGKLSDLECSGRSRSTSPYPQYNSPSSSLDNYTSPFHSNLGLILSDTNGVANPTNYTNLTSSEDLNEIADHKTRKIYNIAKEMMTSEEVFCNVLKLLNVDFRQSVTDQGCIDSKNSGNNRSSRNGLPEDDLNRILNYLPQLQNFSEGFLGDLQQRLTDWDQHHKIADIIVTKGPFLKMYSSYIRDYEHQCNLLDDACSKYPNFNRAVQSFESSEKCCKLGLKHYMLKPVQRIPQYRLLFQSYLDLLPATSPDIVDATKALAILEEVATHANDTIKIEVNMIVY